MCSTSSMRARCGGSPGSRRRAAMLFDRAVNGRGGAGELEESAPVDAGHGSLPQGCSMGQVSGLKRPATPCGGGGNGRGSLDQP